jgi:hypothetical protein
MLDMNKFATETTTREYLTKNKKPSCVDALSMLFDAALAAGSSLREAYWYAEVTHFMNDHDGAAKSEGSLIIEETDEVVKQTIVDELMALNSDGLAEDRVDLVIRWYDFFRASGAPVALAFSMGTQAGQEEWEEGHDLDEAEAISKINEIPSDDLKDFLLRRFYTLRNEGETVRESLRTAREEAEDHIRREALFAALSSGLLGGRPDGGYVN